MFGQQRDERRAWVPNYDLFFFEVETRSGIKMLHEMRPGEMGSLVVSTPILARYKIGDLILAFQPPYFRCIGRDRWWTPLRYAWDEFLTLQPGPALIRKRAAAIAAVSAPPCQETQYAAQRRPR